MKYSKWIGVFGVALMFTAAFQPWIWIASKNITVSGMATPGTNFGKPALMNFYLSAIALICYLVPAVMAKRANLFFCAFNVAWCLRNFIIVGMCRAGECPEKRVGLYLYFASSIIMMLAAFLPDVKLKEPEQVTTDKDKT